MVQPLWIYDGDCGACELGSARIKRLVQPPVAMASLQSVDLEEIGVPDEAVQEGPVLLMPDGRYFVGPAAMGTMLSLSRQPFRTLGRFMLAPVVRHVLGHLGPRAYRARGRLPGAGAHCGVPQAPSTSHHAA